MALNSPRTQFGLSSMTAVNRTTGVPFGMIKVIKSMNSSFERDSVKLYGGANPNPFDAEYGNINMSMSLAFNEFKPFLYKLAYGDDAYAFTAGNANGVVSAMTNVKGTTVGTSITGVNPIALGANLKDGVYYIVAASTSTVKIYNVTDIKAQAGVDMSYVDDTLLTTTLSGQDTLGVYPIVTGSTGVNVNTNLGITFTGGTVNMTAGDAARFEVRGANAGSGSYTYTIGENPVPQEFSAYFYSQVKANGEYTMEHFPRVKFASLPKAMTAKEWAEATINAEVLYDTALGYSARTIDFGTTTIAPQS